MQKKWICIIGLIIAFAAGGCDMLAEPADFSDTTDNSLSKTVFDTGSLSDITISVSTNDWNTLLTYFDLNPDNEMDVRADFSFTKNGSTMMIPDVGLRLKGSARPESTNGVLHRSDNTVWAKPSFKVNFRKFVKGTRFYSLRSLNVKKIESDPSYVRKAFAADLFQRLGVTIAQRSSFAKVRLYFKEDNKSLYLGVYELEEFIDESYLAKSFTGNEEGFLWRCGAQSNLLADLQNALLDEKIGMEVVDHSNANNSFYPVYDLKTKQSLFTNEAKPKLVEFITHLNTRTGDDFKNWIAGAFDVYGFLKILAVGVVLGHYDDYWLGGDNYFLYFDNSGKCTFIPVGFNKCLGHSKRVANTGVHSATNWGISNSGKPLANKILAIPEYNNAYKSYLAELINDSKPYFNYTSATNRIIGWQSLLSGSVANDVVTGEFLMDAPSPDGNAPFYRLLSGDDTGAPDNANFFKTRVRVIKSELGL